MISLRSSSAPKYFNAFITIACLALSLTACGGTVARSNTGATSPATGNNIVGGTDSGAGGASSSGGSTTAGGSNSGGSATTGGGNNSGSGNTGGSTGGGSRNSSQAAQFVYASTLTGQGTIVSALRVASKGSLVALGTALQTSKVVVLGPSDPKGHHVFGCEFDSPTGPPRSIITYSVRPDTGLLQQTSSVTLPPNIVLSGCGIVLNTAGTVIFVPLSIACCTDAGQQTGIVWSFAVNGAGELTQLVGPTGLFGPYTDVAPFSLAVDPAGTFLYAATIDPVDSTVTIWQFSIDSRGGLEFLPLSKLHTTVMGGTNLAITPNGNTLYWGIFSSPQVATFSVDALTGMLTEGASVSCNCVSGGEGGPIAVNSQGTLLFEATQGENLSASGVAPYSIDAGTGIPTPITTSFSPVASGGFPSFVLNTNSNATFLYATGPLLNQIFGFSVSDTGVVTSLPGSPFTTAAGARLTTVNFTP